MIKRFEKGKKGTMVMHKFLPLVMIIAISLCNQGHQVLWCLVVFKNIKRYEENKLGEGKQTCTRLPTIRSSIPKGFNLQHGNKSVDDFVHLPQIHYRQLEDRPVDILDQLEMLSGSRGEVGEFN